jgi:monoamine oxidase
LKQNKIEFYPKLPVDKISNFNAIGMDKGLKMFIKFNRKFYDFSIVNAVNTGYYVDATKNGYISNKGIFTSLVMGKYADAYYENPEKVKNNIIMELDGYYKGQASKHFEEFYFQDWGNEPHIQGVYSYAKPGIANNREQAQLPIDSKLFFAGEAYHTTGQNGTVHGAIETGKLAIKQMLRS